MLASVCGKVTTKLPDFYLSVNVDYKSKYKYVYFTCSLTV